MSLAEKAAASRFEEVEAGGFRWRVKRVRSADVLEVGFPMLTLIGRSEATGEAATVRDVVAQAGEDPRALASLVAQRDALVCAGVVAFAVAPVEGAEPVEGAPTPGEFEAVRLVLNEADEDASGGRLWVETFDQGVRTALWAKVMELSAVEGQSAARALRAFR